MISFTGVCKEYGGHEVLSDITFQVTPGEFVCLTGPSGAGKSTIVHLLIRAELPTKGVIEVDGADISKLPRPILQLYRQRTGVVFQDYKLLPDRTVEENVAFALEVCGEPDEIIDERVAEVLSRLRMADHADAFPHQLSGGEKTRAALARALVHKPSILIADEPTGNIDPDQSGMILKFLKDINAEGTTVILASHDKLVVDALNVRVVRLEAGKLVRDSVGAYHEEAVPQKEGEPVQVAEAHPRGTHVPKPHHARKLHVHKAPHSHKAAAKTDEDPPSGGAGKIKPIAI